VPTSLVALQIFLILLPGFAAAYVVQQLATRSTQTDLERVIEALLFSFVIYVCFVGVTRQGLPFHMAKSSAGQADSIVWDPGHLGILAAITFAFAFAAVLYINHDGNRLFRRLHLTERTTRSSIWTDIFESEAGREQVVQVELPGGRSILGILLYYSDDPSECSLFVTHASWVDSHGRKIPIPGQGILLTKESGILSISLLSPGGEGADRA